jgi:multiple sugar transport system ATP-binding protein
VSCPAFANPLTVRAGGDVDLSYGTKIFLTPDKAHLHRFDDKGLRLT